MRVSEVLGGGPKFLEDIMMRFFTRTVMRVFIIITGLWIYLQIPRGNLCSARPLCVWVLTAPFWKCFSSSFKTIGLWFVLISCHFLIIIIPDLPSTDREDLDRLPYFGLPFSLTVSLVAGVFTILVSRIIH